MKNNLNLLNCNNSDNNSNNSETHSQSGIPLRRTADLKARSGDNHHHFGFTLAETLIALAVIGIVAALTIPGFVKRYQEKAWATAQTVFENRLDVAMKVMNTQEKLAGYNSTADFIDELKKNIKITEVCEDNVTYCFANEVIWNYDDGAEEIGEHPVFTLSGGLKSGDTIDDVVGVRFNNGVTALMAYLKDDCEEDPYNNQFAPMSKCLAIIYDVNGYKAPNSLATKGNMTATDINGINVTGVNGTTGCLIAELQEKYRLCITQILGPGTGYSAMSLSECEAAVEDGSLGIKTCYYDSDYWAGAVRACGGTSNMPTEAQLTTLAQYLYIIEDTRDKDRSLPFIQALDTTYDAQFSIWSGVESTITGGVYFGVFPYNDNSYIEMPSRSDSINILAVCVAN